MAIAQDKGTTSQAGLSAELIVIASVIIGGASILGGRGRVIGSCLGAFVIVLIDKVLREGVTYPGDHRGDEAVSAIGGAQGLTTFLEAYNCHAPVAGWRRHHGHRLVVRSRKPGHYPRLR
jgi:hypothetical protein